MSRHVVRRHLGRSIVASAVAWAVSQANAQTIDFNGLAIPAGLDRTAIPVTYQPINGLTINFGGVGIYNGGPGLGGGAGNNNAYTFGTADTYQSYLFSRPVRIDSLALTGFGGSDLRPLTVRAYSSAIASPETLLGSFAITPKPHASGTYPTNAWTTFTGAAALGARVRSLVVSGLTDDPQVDNIAVTVGAPNSTPVTPAVRVMPLGDSITHGSSRPNDPIGFPGYRYALAGNFQRAGTNVDYVGSNRYMPNGKQPYNFFYPASSTTNDVFFDQDHEGHSGYTTADLINKPADGFSLATALQGNVPDVVMLHAGTNDVGKNLSIGSAVANIKTIIDTLRLANPNVKVALAKITPITPSSDGHGQYAANVATFNNALGTAAAGWGTVASPVLVVDQNKGYDPTAMHFDGLHPNSRGEQLIADRFFVAYHKLMNPGGPLVSPAPHIGNGTFDELEVNDDGNIDDDGDRELTSFNDRDPGFVGNGWTMRAGWFWLQRRHLEPDADRLHQLGRQGHADRRERFAGRVHAQQRHADERGEPRIGRAAARRDPPARHRVHA